MNITRFNPLAFDDEDIFISTSDKAGLAKIVKIIGAPEMTNNEDVEYFHKQLLGVLKVPTSYNQISDVIKKKTLKGFEEVRDIARIIATKAPVVNQNSKKYVRSYFEGIAKDAEEILALDPTTIDEDDLAYDLNTIVEDLKEGLIAIGDYEEQQASKNLLAPDCTACGGDGGNHKLGCPVVRGKK